MPKIRRWFNVSHDINSDPEVWELTERFGDRGLRAWLEILSIADRNDGLIPGDPDRLVRALSIKLNTYQVRTRSILGWCEDRTWLIRDPNLRVRNYWIYRGSREAKKNLIASPPHTTHTPHSLKKKNKILCAVLEFPPDWKWLQNLVESQNGNFPKERFLDFAWWDAVSETCGGLSEEWLTVQFAGIKRWIMENPTREPTPKGYRRFVGGWLERSYEKERRYGPTKR